MVRTSPLRRLRAPELIGLVALLGIALVGGSKLRSVSPRAEVAPPETLRCGHPDAPVDCFVPVPGGTFLMGAQAAAPASPGYDDAASQVEGPVHQVAVSPFWLMRTEATVGTYRRCVTAGACEEGEVVAGGGFSTYYPASAERDGARDMWPVNGVTWQGAVDLCAWLGGRLPTEAEWELAARGTDGRRWTWGDRRICTAPADDDGFARLRRDRVDICEQDGPARADDIREPGPYGTLGQSGNLWEWVLEAWDPDAYADHDAEDPIGPLDGDVRTQRGGSWMATLPEEVRVAVRGGLDAGAQLNDVGFRCALGGAH